MEAYRIILKSVLLVAILAAIGLFLISVLWPVIWPDEPNPWVGIKNWLPIEIPIYALVLLYAISTYQVLTALVVSFLSI